MERGAVKNQRQQNYKKKQPQYSAKIVFSKGNAFQTLPCLSDQLKGIYQSVGLNYVWEYRSPSKSAPPHYQCKACFVSRLQNEMIAHIKSWKHCLKYLQKCHPDKVKWKEEEALDDIQVRKEIKSAAAEIVKKEGKGQIRVILKEPFDVPAFKGLWSAKQPPLMKHAGGQFNPQFPGPFPPQGDPFSYHMDEYSQPRFENVPSRSEFPDSGNNQRSFHGGMEDHSPMSGTVGYLSGQHEENHGKFYPDKYLDSRMDGPMNRTTDSPDLPEASPPSRPSTLLSYLDVFRIENEDDAKLVLQVTQKLTDALMEYRLRSVNQDSNNSSMSNSNLSQPPSRFPEGSSRFSDDPSRLSDGPSRFSDDPSRFSDGPSRLPDGPSRLPDGPSRLPDGPSRLPDGPSRLPDGPSRLPDGPSRYPDGPSRYPDGPSRYPDGPSRYPDGPSRYPDGPSRYPDGPSRYPDGPSRYPDGPSRYPDGPSRYSDGPSRFYQ